MHGNPRRAAACVLVAVVGLVVSACSGMSRSAPVTSSVPKGALDTSTCRSADLSASIQHAQGAAGTFYYPVELTNQSAHACTLRGYPTVSVVDAGGSRLGLLAGRAPLTTPVAAHLSPGASATTVIAWSDVLNECDAHVHASGFRIQLPGQPGQHYVAQSLQVCVERPVMTVTPIEASAVASASVQR